LNTLSSSLPVPGQGVIGAKGSVTTDSWGSFAQAFEEIQQIVTNRRRLGYTWPLFELFDDKTTPQVTVIRRFLDPIVRQVLLDKETMKNSGIESRMEEKTFIQHLAESTKGQTIYLPKMISFILINIAVDAGLIRDQILSVLLASRDTVYILSITLATLSTHRPSDSLPVDLRHLFLDDVPRHH